MAAGGKKMCHGIAEVDILIAMEIGVAVDSAQRRVGGKQYFGASVGLPFCCSYILLVSVFHYGRACSEFVWIVAD